MKRLRLERQDGDDFSGKFLSSDELLQFLRKIFLVIADSYDIRAEFSDCAPVSARRVAGNHLIDKATFPKRSHAFLQRLFRRALFEFPHNLIGCNSDDETTAEFSRRGKKKMMSLMEAVKCSKSKHCRLFQP